MQSYQEALDFLYSQLPMYQRVGQPAFKKGLGNTRALLSACGNPHEKFPTIHIAGTNGKGTVSHMLAACLTAAGFKTGLYVSPHYRDFRERIKIDGKLISKKEVVDFVNHLKPEITKSQPSFFEMTVAMAFHAFAQNKVDIAVIETGLGGRLDSTNVISPLLSVITNISFDHMAMLGNTLPKIAREKAGIIKKNTPVVIGEWQHAVASVFRKKAEAQAASLSFASRSMKAVKLHESLEHQTYDVVGKKGKTVWRNLRIGCAGPFQATNLVTALHALHVLGETHPAYRLPASAIRKGMLEMKHLAAYQGRWEVLSKHPLVLTDSAHNEGGLSIVLSQIARMKYNNLHCVIGFVKEKELAAILSLFPQEAKYYFCKPDIPRGLDTSILQDQAQSHGLNGESYSSVRKALRAAKNAAKRSDMVFVGGSTFVVAEVI